MVRRAIPKGAAVFVGIAAMTSAFWLPGWWAVLAVALGVVLAPLAAGAGPFPSALRSKDPEQAVAWAASAWVPTPSSLMVGVVVACIALCALVPLVVKSTDAYELAVAAARGSPRYIQALGDPVREGWFVKFRFEWVNPETATLEIPVEGRRREGVLKAQATKHADGWRLEELALELGKPTANIRLLPPAGPSEVPDR